MMLYHIVGIQNNHNSAKSTQAMPDIGTNQVTRTLQMGLYAKTANANLGFAQAGSRSPA